jgi:hypothetical protein
VVEAQQEFAHARLMQRVAREAILPDFKSYIPKDCKDDPLDVVGLWVACFPEPPRS